MQVGERKMYIMRTLGGRRYASIGTRQWKRGCNAARRYVMQALKGGERTRTFNVPIGRRKCYGSIERMRQKRAAMLL